MAKTIVKTIDNRGEWEDFLSKHPEANFLQSFYWGEFHQILGAKFIRSAFYQKNELEGVMLSIVEDAKRGRYLTVPAGPIIDWRDEELVKSFVEEIKRIAKQEKCVFIRVRPQLLAEVGKSIFAKLGFKDAPMHLHAELTSQLDITLPQEQLLANMRKATRYEIKKAISQNIKVTSTVNPSSIKDFFKLQLNTAKRQNFVPFSYQFLMEQFSVFAKNNLALLYSAKFKDQLLAQAFIIFYGEEAIYHYGASTQDGRKYPGAYLIQWEAITEAKKRGIKRYNFWGVAPLNNPDHRFFGVSIFKRGFGGREIEYLHAQDLVIDRPRYLLNFAVETIRKTIRKV